MLHRLAGKFLIPRPSDTPRPPAAWPPARDPSTALLVRAGGIEVSVGVSWWKRMATCVMWKSWRGTVSECRLAVAVGSMR